jgi:alkylation response protein AidB-like acyl-CoA dehydrogenase
MDQLLREEHAQLKGVVRSFLQTRCPLSTASVEGATDAGDRGIWSQLCGELGLVGLAVPEDFGGSGAGLRELGFVMEEAGRVLLSQPLLSTSIAVQALLLSQDVSACEAYLPRLVSGDLTAAVAWTTTRGARLPWGALTASGWTVSGVAKFVLDGQRDGLVILLCDTDEGQTVLLVEAHGGVSRRSLPTLDLTRPQAEISFDEAAATPLGRVGGGGELLAPIQERAWALLACEQVGAAERCLEMSLEYARTRVQFGRAIGSFQAIKHKCADMYVRLEAARAAARYAVTAADERPEELAVAVLVASAYVSEALLFIASETIQIHGGIGFTWEHPAHLYFRRAKSTELIGLPPRQAREALVTTLGA